MPLSDFHFDLPAELIAQSPPLVRGASRMLVVDRASGTWHDRRFTDFPEYVRAGDCLVLNDSKVIAARLFGKRGGADVEVFLVEQQAPDEPHVWRTLGRPGKRLRPGDRVEFETGASAEVLEQGERGTRLMRFSEPAIEIAQRIGHMPLPPYIKRQDAPEDRDRYQTVYSSPLGSVAAPTAGLHFTPEILDACRARGADMARVTLHVGLGTFQPIDDAVVAARRLHAERFEITAENALRMRAARRLICTGTTSVRVVESAGLNAASGSPDIFIQPGYEFRHAGAMLTNFHLPETSLLMLVAAFAGRDLTLAAYRHAVSERYRFFSYGDCMLIL